MGRVMFYSPKELAEVLGVHIKTLAMWRRNETGPKYVKVGKLVRYHRQAVRDWLLPSGLPADESDDGE